MIKQNFSRYDIGFLIAFDFEKAIKISTFGFSDIWYFENWKCYQKNDRKDLKKIIFKKYDHSIGFAIKDNYYSLKKRDLVIFAAKLIK